MSLQQHDARWRTTLVQTLVVVAVQVVVSVLLLGGRSSAPAALPASAAAECPAAAPEQPQTPQTLAAEANSTGAGGKDLFITYAAGYHVEHLCPTLRSLVESGFAGDVVLLVGKLQGSVEQFRQWMAPHPQIRVVEAPEDAADDVYFDRSVRRDIVLTRFHAMYRFLAAASRVERRNPCSADPRAHWCGVDRITYNYRYVISTDIRDVIFQVNPSLFLEKHLGRSRELYGQELDLVVSSEGSVVDSRQWTKGNQGTCTPHYYNTGGHKELYYNAGQMAGTQAAIMSLMRSIYEEQKYHDVPSCDQAALNQIIHADPWTRQRTLFSSACSGWTELAQFIDRNIHLQYPYTRYGVPGNIRANCSGGEDTKVTIVHNGDINAQLRSRYSCPW
eukprot:m51a1_g14194 hypothetical protein (389) ;mRNA; r:110075-111345